MRVYNKAQITEIESNCEKNGITTLELMETVGKAAFNEICRIFGDNINSVAVVCGNGNNGGDGLVAARYFAEKGIKTTVILAFGGVKTDNSKAVFEKLGNVEVIDYVTDKTLSYGALNNADVVIDAVYGIGFHGEIPSDIAELTSLMAKNRNKTVAFDVPSGAECDNGQVSANCVKAAFTLAFIACKPCHFLYPSAEYCGKVIEVNLNLAEKSYVNQTIFLVTDNTVKPVVGNKRPKDCHKYDFGRALLICGSYGMAGAAKLAATAAIKCGAGLVTVCLPKSIYPIVASNLNEAVFNPLKETEKGRVSRENAEKITELVLNANATLIGCGMGCDDDTSEILKTVITNSENSVVVDADGINCVSRHIDIIKENKAPLILTPHIGEMARLCGINADEIKRDIINVGKRFAQKYGIILVLKGARTATFTPDGFVYINLSGNSGMATAGSGDMLAGMIVSLLAQGVEPTVAAYTAVYLHGKSGDVAVNRCSERAMTPSDMINLLGDIFLNFEN